MSLGGVLIFVSAAAHTVAPVVLVSASVDMIRPDTRRVIALVTREKSVLDWSIGLLENPSV